MLIIRRDTKDPYFNIAAEEYLIKSLEQPCFMLWQNKPSVIIGKHQNPLREVNLEFLKQKKIPIIRRISGGGTVYHDLGNLNYSFIDIGKADSLVNFSKYSQPIIDVLQGIKVDAKLVGKSDLKIAGKKFSGNASHVYKNKVLHHGTLLFNSDLEVLNESIRIKENYIQDKAVNSNRSTVTNIAEHINHPLSIEDFESLLIQHIKNRFPDSNELSLNQIQKNEIKALVDKKYSKWEWNFGYSPKYSIQSDFQYKSKIYNLKFNMIKGFIEEIGLPIDIPSELKLVFLKLQGIQHHPQIVEQELSNYYSHKLIDPIIDFLF